MTKPTAQAWVSDNVRLDVVTRHRIDIVQRAIVRAFEEARLARTLRVVTVRVQPRIQSLGPDGPLIRDPEWDTAAAIVRAASKHRRVHP